MRFTALLALPALLRHVLAYTALSEETIKHFPHPSDADFNIHDGKLLAPILIPRVPGSEGSKQVLQHFVDFFTNNLPGWTLTYQNSTSTTPTSKGKQIPFVNLIATRDPPWITKEAGGDGNVGRLALVAHYDSKLTPEGFIGATDSAAPCAMLLHVAQALDNALTKKWEGMDATEAELDGSKGLQILLLDGEEAFATWNHDDSLYGARSLAEDWEQTIFGATSTYRNPLDAMELFVLLDLLGAKNPQVPSYFKTTHWAYQKMAALETRLRGRLRLATSTSGDSVSSPFLPEAEKKDTDRWLGGYIEDDHVPFMAKGVEILHVITSPFPQVWHTIKDDGEHLDIPTVKDWATLTTAFTAEWMELEGFLELEPESDDQTKGKRSGSVRDEL
ncbi:peptidase family M28 protein [Polychaeton citri CBS 116435]|uniref:Peptide hydrolase n=1 Tax=Polychaeton citri CBS 116435 TaxID=1314669 RepID=A0A9P4Q8I3_9PEZI|nr:peptidase family M28 protein [Polychaeton citri CBS 116435]